MGTKNCPSCGGSGKSGNKNHPHCLGCGGSGTIETPDSKERDRILKNWKDPDKSGGKK